MQWLSLKTEHSVGFFGNLGIVIMRWLRQPAGDPLTVSMSSIKLGDRLLMIGGSDVGLIAALAGKAGLTGRTCLVDESESITSRSARMVEREGALIESFTAPYASLPFEAEAFDVVVIRSVLRMLSAERRSQLSLEAHRVLRPGGRCICIEGSPRTGLSALFGGGLVASAAGIEASLTTVGFRGARTLAERAGLTFVEGVKSGR